MNKDDLDAIVRWAISANLDSFSEEAYGITGTAFERMKDDYILNKYENMQSNFIMWLAKNIELKKDKTTKGE